jgi:hypothetical protein
MTDRKRVTNYELLLQVQHIAKDLDEFKNQYNTDMRGDAEFKEQYEADMRGDKKIDGNIGIINELRDIRRIIREYPSMLWLLKNELGWLGVGH